MQMLLSKEKESDVMLRSWTRAYLAAEGSDLSLSSVQPFAEFAVLLVAQLELFLRLPQPLTRRFVFGLHKNTSSDERNKK